MTTPGLPQTTPARLPDQEVWESSARESLLRHLPVRASLIGLVGAGLTSFGASPAAATLTGPDSNGLCTATDETSVVAAMENTACESVTVPGPITLDDGLTVVKPLTLEGPTTLSGYSPLKLSETTTAGGSVGSLHIEDTVTVDRSAYIQVMASSVTISGSDPASSRIVSTSQLPYAAQLIKVCSAYGQPCEPGWGDPATISDIAITRITLDGAEVRPALLVNAANMSIDNVHVVNGAARGFSTRSGGIAARNSQIQISDSNFENNTKWSGGGAILAWDSALTISSTSFTDNIADEAGAIKITGGSSQLLVDHSLFRGNGAPSGDGGAVYGSGGALTFTNSVFDSNTASRDGGAVFGYYLGSLTIVNSTLVNNVAGGDGGAVMTDYYAGSVAIRHSTFANNSATRDGGAIFEASGSGVEISHSIMVGNSAASGDDFASTASSINSWNWDFNILSSTPVIAGATISQDATGPSLGTWFAATSAEVFGANTLADNGGLISTLALQTSAPNPAINSGDATLTAGVNGVPASDARGTGFDRIQNGRIDIGSFESAQLAPSSSAPNAPSTPPVEPLLPSVMPVLSLSGSTLQCALGEFTEVPTQVDATLIVGGVRQEMRRIAMPATTVTWELDLRWRGQSVSCEVLASEGKRVATVLTTPVMVPAAVTPSPTPTTPAPTTPAEPARGFAASSIRFAPLSSALDAADRRAIASLVEQAGTGATFRVTGYVQAVGSTRNDRALSLARAQAVTAELRRLGVATSNITATGGGRSQRDGAAARRATVTARWTR